MTNRTFMTVEEGAAELGVSKSYAYKIVKQLNEELQKLGYLTVAGRVNTNYFRKKYVTAKCKRKRGEFCMSIHKDNARISYISSHAKQENLYAVYETTERKFWRELANVIRKNL